ASRRRGASSRRRADVEVSALKASVAIAATALVGAALGVGIAGWPERMPNDVVIDEAARVPVGTESVAPLPDPAEPAQSGGTGQDTSSDSTVPVAQGDEAAGLAEQPAKLGEADSTSAAELPVMNESAPGAAAAPGSPTSAPSSRDGGGSNAGPVGS